MTTTPSSQLHFQLLLPLILLVILAAMAEGRRPGCPDKCGDISIHFPFGIGTGCFRDGFEVLCNHSSGTPRLFFSNNIIRKGNDDSSPLELLSISVETGKARALAPVSHRCSTNDTASSSMDVSIVVGGTPFALSARNVLIAVGWSAVPRLYYFDPSELQFSCLAYNIVFSGDRGNGTCTEGCCEFAPARVARVLQLDVDFGYAANAMWPILPCAYGMLVEKSWYKYYTADMYNYTLLNRTTMGVPLALDFAAGEAACPAKGQPPPPDYACVSGNSSCANATFTPGYICKCWDHYAGNPYVPDGCQDIDECKRPQVYPCSSGAVCRNRLGGYDCPCKFGLKGDGKAGTCTHIFSPAAKATVGLAALVVVIVLMVLAHQLLKLRKFYKQNGGPILEGVKNIRIYTSKQLKKMTNNYKVVIGEGHFGKVYMGTLKDTQHVAIKKTIKVNEASKKDFIAEIIIQSGMRHKNIARLLGCCLEMDVPMLMYEYVVKGSLYDVLFKSKDNILVDTRLRIAIGSAEGLAYMHSAVESTIRHGDVKSANILLDASFTPKISDFGTSKLLARGNSMQTEWVTGDKAYIDPTYMVHGIVTQKSDVYNFGIVLIEIITRRVAIYDDNMSYAKNFVLACQDQRVRNFVDNDITSENDMEILEMVSKVALECLKLNPEERLDMTQVESRLRNIGQSE
ncbi:hypothetical protein CFC21_005123 [Triticum aestivum]|uniref:Protein kinase domain-containing protein n=2 Tax=Triticum aestivum TaxID=4565 RepID=A0A3B5YR52_WHEAT|nr:hypothetical protein CFC21_005123 [Triticum aestivum]